MVKKELKIVNIVASSYLNHDIPLIRLAEKVPKTSALIFGSGKIVCTGARSMAKLRESIKQIVKNIEKIGIKITIKPRVKVQNMVASGEIGMDLNLNKLAMELENTEYEPEQFPGLVYKLSGTRATFLLFSNGKIVCTGTRSEANLKEALDKLIDNLLKLKKK